MKKPNGNSEGLTNKSNVSLMDNERCLKNESFFSSFIDLVPARIYLNGDDRLEWIKQKTLESRKRKFDAKAKADLKKKKNASDDENDDNNNDEEDVDILDETDNGLELQYKRNRFDPRFFKTVSEILKDLDKFQKRNKTPNTNDLIRKNSQQMAAKDDTDGKVSNTNIKVFNKSQNKSAKAATKDNDSTNENGINNDGAKTQIKKQVYQFIMKAFFEYFFHYKLFIKRQIVLSPRLKSKTI
jgi:hypothetical protein